MFSLLFDELWLVIQWITMKICRIQAGLRESATSFVSVYPLIQNACRTGVRNLPYLLLIYGRHTLLCKLISNGKANNFDEMVQTHWRLFNYWNLKLFSFKVDKLLEPLFFFKEKKVSFLFLTTRSWNNLSFSNAGWFQSKNAFFKGKTRSNWKLINIRNTWRWPLCFTLSSKV